MKLTFYGAAKSVTGSNYLLESQGYKILIDCGLFQGGYFSEKENFEPFGYGLNDVKAAIVTHAHIDHTGRLPKLIKDGFAGKVYSTPPTREAAYYLLLDSEHLLKEAAEHFKLPHIYSIEDIENLMQRWDAIDYHQDLMLGPFKITFYNAGHILGSISILIEAENKKIVFSGDLGNSPAPLIGSKELSPEKIDYCLIESTYGGRIHEDVAIRKDAVEDLVEETVSSGGVLMIPIFAMERTQELLYEINELVEHNRIPQASVFLDSPLAIKLTGVYRKYQNYFSEEAWESAGAAESFFNFPGLKISKTSEDSKAINEVRPPKVVIAGSGMLNGGRILHHAIRYLPDPKSTLLIIGYQAKESLGRKLLNGEKHVKIFGQEVPVGSKIKMISGYSAHADQPQLLEWLTPARQSLKTAFIVHGEEDQAEALAQKIKDDLAVKTIIPDKGCAVEL